MENSVSSIIIPETPLNVKDYFATCKPARAEAGAT